MCVYLLAAAVIHWTDQVKEALTDHKPGQSVLKKGWGPLQELDLWRSRSTKLLDIEKQLQSWEVQHVLSILHVSKSVYVQRFLRLTKEIQVGTLGNVSPPGIQTSSISTLLSLEILENLFLSHIWRQVRFWSRRAPSHFHPFVLYFLHHVPSIPTSCSSAHLLFVRLQEHSRKAAVNVKFLSLLKEPCEELGRLRPSEVAPKMRRLVQLVCTIWANNQHYGGADSTGELFLMVPPTPLTR